jgi:hypothetical protein
MTKLEPSHPMPNSKGASNNSPNNGQWSQPLQDPSATSLNYPSYSSSFPSTPSQGVGRPTVANHGAATSVMAGKAEMTMAHACLLPLFYCFELVACRFVCKVDLQSARK